MNRKSLVLTLALATTAATGVTSAAAHVRGGHGGAAGLRAARAANEQYRAIDVALADGFAELRDVDGIACIDNPGVGGMGIHYVRGDRVADPAERATEPEVLVYAPRRNGRLRLVALEYVVLQADWDAQHAGPPRLFGRTFELVPAGNRYGLPAFYELHAWLFKKNPRGVFDDWNPRVHCPA